MSLESASEYALSFSEDAVHLQRRERTAGEAAPHAVPVPGAWRHLGSVDFDSAAFAEEFKLLRAMAQAEDDELGDTGDMLPVTLLIPEDQILYTTLTVAPGADREKAVARALDGLTPYAIEDLAFDWEGDGDSVRVAAVARQTLREASDFARQYGFDGNAFRATPRDDSFAGEPVFALVPAPRPRPEVDPARVSVTSAGLMIEPDPQDPSAEDAQAELDLDLSADSMAAGAKATGQEAPKEAQKEVATTEIAAAETSAAGPDVAAGDEVSASEPVEPAVAEPAVAVVAAPIVTDAPAPAVEATARDAAPAEAANATISGIAPEAGSDAKSEPAAKAPPVVRHAPARPSLAQPDAGKSEPVMTRAETRADMNPRARAVHERAAEARQTRPAGTAPAGIARRPGERGGLLELVAMLGALVVGLILIWAFLVPDHEVAQTSETPVATVAEAPLAPAEEAAGQGAQPIETAALPETSAEPAPVPAVEAPVETASVAAVAPTAVATTATAPAPEQAPQMASALTEQERRRVMVAAAAVAAAVVPPAVQPAASDPAAPETAAPEIATGESTEEPAEVATTETPAQTATETATQALTAATAPAARPARTEPVAAAPAAEPVTASRPLTQRAAVEQALRAAVESTAVEPARLTSSARPQLAPRRSTPQTSIPSADAAPRVPANPLPFAATQRRAQPANSARPPERARRATPKAAASSPAAAPATETPSATASNSAPRLRGSARPPGRPEGSAPNLILDEGAQLTPAETDHLDRLRQRLDQAQAPAMGQLPPDSMLAQARPQRKPGSAGAATSSDAVSASAIDAAVRSATGSPPDKPQRADAAAPARDSGGLLRSSARPNRRPGSGGAASGLSDTAVEAAIAAAVEASPATPGGVQLSALASSPLPPRRGGGAGAGGGGVSAVAAAVATPDIPGTTATPEPSGPDAAELAERRKLDEQLQAQAEARVRARAQADAQAEAQARAQAEARARAQAEAEERAALASRQKYKPPEVDDEPEVEAAALSQGITSASVAKSATQKRGINPGRTTIIGIIGAGKASRALIRLRNGKIVTVRLGDRIDGGTINSIGDGRITYVKSGRTHELRMLDGR